MLTNKRKYEELALESTGVPIFSQPWWLDAVCGPAHWNACVVEKNGQPVGAFPFQYKRKAFFKTITMPQLTQCVSLWIQEPNSLKQEKVLSHQKTIISELIQQLPPYDYFNLNFYHSLTNWLPFYWHGFGQTTRYTYIIQDLNSLDDVFQSFSHAKRKNIKRAEKLLKLGPELSGRELFNHHSMTLAKKNQTVGYSVKTLERLYEATQLHNCGKILSAVDTSDNVVAVIFIVWDKKQTYYLISSIDPEHQNSGAATFLLKHAITLASNVSESFDFEGSMIENVENSFRQFGTQQTPYFKITHTPARLLRFKKLLDSR
ncbi:MAG: hypothetical protein ACR2NF_05705 [Pirellulales bacterium]